MSLNRSLLVKMGKEVFVDSKSKFSQCVHRRVSIFDEETAIFFRESSVENPVHRLNFPMFPCKFYQPNIPAEDVIAGLPAVMSTSLYALLNGENRLQSRPFVFLLPGNILDFGANPLFNLSMRPAFFSAVWKLFISFSSAVSKNRRTSSSKDG